MNSNTKDMIALMARIDRLLVELLKSLGHEAWDMPTIAGAWRVRDVVAHLLDGNMRGIATSRDGHFGVQPAENISDYRALVDFLNRYNAEWVQAARRISPRLLIDLLELTNQQYRQHLASLDPTGEALFSVAWAGEEISTNAFHIAREYMEKWHHQAQIRLAVGQIPPLLEEELYVPFLDTAMQALPYHYRTETAETGVVIRFRVSGLSAYWDLAKKEKNWRLTPPSNANEIALEVAFPADIAWRVFTNGISRADSLGQVSITGHANPNLGEHLLSLLAVMA